MNAHASLPAGAHAPSDIGSDQTAKMVRYNTAKRALAEALAVDEVKDILDKTVAVQAYAHQAKDRQLELDAAEIRFRAERRLGELLAVTEKAKGTAGTGRPSLGGSKRELPKSAPTLAQLGIDKKLSARAQKMAAVPEPEFEAQLAEFRERAASEHKRITRNLLKKSEKGRAAETAPIEGGGNVEDLHALAKTGVKFKTIYADPPWPCETTSDKGQVRSAIHRCGTPTIDEIKALPVATLADDDAVLHLWTSPTQVPAALEVIKAWGFTYRNTGFIWLKATDDGKARKMGNGKWIRDEAEVCLFATKGNPKRLDANVRQTFDAPLGRHGEKPEEFRHRTARSRRNSATASSA